MLHKGQPAPPVRDLDEGQETAGAVPDKGHRDHEQRLAALHTGQPEPPGTLHLHAL